MMLQGYVAMVKVETYPCIGTPEEVHEQYALVTADANGENTKMVAIFHDQDMLEYFIKLAVKDATNKGYVTMEVPHGGPDSN